MEEKKPPPDTVVRLLGASSFIFFSTSGIILNLLLMAVLYKGRKSFNHNAFFVISWQLIICDVWTHLIEFIVPIPLTLMGYDIYNGSLIGFVPCQMETFAYIGTLLFSFLMTLNRITVFILPKLNNFLFRRYLLVPIALIWLVDAAFVIVWNNFGCYKVFGVQGYHYNHLCPEEMKIGFIMHLIFINASTYLPVLMLIIYVIMICFIKLQLNYTYNNGKIVRRQATVIPVGGQSHAKMEFQLLAQGFVICGMLEIENLVFNFLPLITVSGQWIYALDFVGSCVSLILCCSHPIVLFIFNSDIRKRLRMILSLPTSIKSVPNSLI